MLKYGHNLILSTDMKYKSLILILLAAAFMASCTLETSNNLADAYPLQWLEGNWQAKAFDGELHEYWQTAAEDLFLKKGYYIEDNDTSYWEVAKITKINNDLLIIAIPMGNEPIVFKATTISSDEVVFENQSHSGHQPTKVVYKFVDETHFTRTTSGSNQGQPFSTEYSFVRFTN